MKVEIIDALEVEEAASVEVGEEALAIIEKLELKGQKSLLKEEGSTLERMPFRKATSMESWVYSVLCPEQTELADYSEDPIPHRVLERAAFAKESGMFTKGLYVWHQAGAIKYPVLVGYNGDGWQWNRNGSFILARWGEKLDELSTLTLKARRIAHETIQAGVSKLEFELNMLKSRAEAQLLTDEELGISQGRMVGIVDGLIRR